MAQEQHRGAGARKVEIERRLDANADISRRNLATDAAEGEQHPAFKGSGGHGHKAQAAQPQRIERPGGGNSRAHSDE